jgi:hypothetical protein
MLIRKWVKPFHVCSSKRVCPTFLLARIQQKMEEEKKEEMNEEKLISSSTQTEQLLIKREEKEEEEKDNKIIHQFPSLEIPHQIPPIKKKVLITEIEA